MAHLKDQERKGKILAINAGTISPIASCHLIWFADLSFFPEELHGVYDQDKAKKWAASHVSTRGSGDGKSFGDALAKLKDLESKEATEGTGNEEDEEDEEVIYEEEEFEDETDYNLSYFDDGDDFGDRDDGDDGPVY